MVPLCQRGEELTEQDWIFPLMKGYVPSIALGAVVYRKKAKRGGARHPFGDNPPGRYRLLPTATLDLAGRAVGSKQARSAAIGVWPFRRI